MIRLVINADDYGIAECQTEAILECFRMGIQTSTTVMVTMPDFERATKRAKEEGVFDKIGLHLNFTQGTPITEPIRRLKIFCNEDGSFSKVFHRSMLHRMWLTNREQSAVALEAEAQMRRYLDAGYPLKHLDSHHHSHTDLAMAAVILPIAKRLGFRTARISRNLPRPGYGVLKKIYKWLSIRETTKSGLVHTDYFGSVGDLAYAIDKIPASCTVEIMTHPSRQVEGEFVVQGGTLMDMHEPMTTLQVLLENNKDKLELVTYAKI